MSSRLFDSIRTVLLEYGINENTNDGPHSWRCEYGECDCLEELTNDILRAMGYGG